MSTAFYRAWRFFHPDFDLTAKAAGLQVSNRGGIEMIEGKSSVQQAVLLLLSIRPGERVMRPNYGCDLHRLVFSQNDDTTAGLAIHYVRQAIERWEPRIEVTRLDARRSADDSRPGILEIHLEYRVRATQQRETLVYAFDLTGERT